MEGRSIRDVLWISVCVGIFGSNGIETVCHQKNHVKPLTLNTNTYHKVWKPRSQREHACVSYGKSTIRKLVWILDIKETIIIIIIIIISYGVHFCLL